MNRARGYDRAFHVIGAVMLLAAIGALGVLLWDVARDGLGRLSIDFLTGAPSRRASNAGLWPALMGSLWLMGLTAAMAIPVGVGAAIALEEYGGRGRWSRLLEINIANLAGVPSVVYGLLGLGLFVRALHWGPSLLAGAATLALLVLPIVIITTREALRTVPLSLREASLALGATRWQTIRYQVLPAAWPGMLTGIILTMARAIGETAPLVVIGALAYVPFAPEGPHSPFTALPVQIFAWVMRPREGFRTNAAAAILVLLVVLLVVNGLAIYARDRAARRRAA